MNLWRYLKDLFKDQTIRDLNERISAGEARMLAKEQEASEAAPAS